MLPRYRCTMPEGLADRLAARIAREGSVPFRDFMEAALYDPDDGYYGSGRAAIGRGGDFYTSVSVGPLFGRLLARQFAEMWERLGRPHVFDVVEQGAHDGQFACDALDGLREQSPECFAQTRYTIIEPGERFRRRQQEKLAAYGTQVRYLPSIDALEAFSGVHFSNELVDAFPVHRVRFSGESWHEQRVTYYAGAFSFVDSEVAAGGELEAALRDLPRNVAPGFHTEVNLEARHWVRGAAEKLARGWMLAIDYGHAAADFFDPSRAAGTLAAYREHRRCDDPLSDPGSQDLTAHVDFTALAREGLSAGMDLVGFTDQHHFMVGLSRLHFHDAAELTPQRQREILAFKTLMHPGLLGMNFRVLCLGKGTLDVQPISGFALAREGHTALGLD